MKIKSYYLSYKLSIALIIGLLSVFSSLQAAEPDTSSQLQIGYGAKITAQDSAKVLKTFEEDIEKILRTSKLYGTSYGIAVYSLEQHKYYYKKNINNLLTPASNTKIFSSLAALFHLGNSHYVTTQIFTDDDNLKDSVINGNLFIVGHGDAMFNVYDLDTLVYKIRDMGIKKVTGNVYGDGTFFDPETDRKIYSGDRDRVMKLPPITALSIEGNEATVEISADGKPGDYLDVTLIPNSEAFLKKVTAKVRGYSRKSGFNYDIEPLRLFEEHPDENDEILRLGDAAPDYDNSMRRRSCYVRSNLLESGKQLFSVSGYLYPNRSYSYRYYIRKPAYAVAGALKNRLILEGVIVEGDADVKPLSEIDSTKKPKFIVQNARPLPDILSTVNKNSNNYLAENIYKMIGAENGNHEDNAVGTREVIKRMLDSLDIECESCMLNDGSGLSRRNLVTVDAVTKLLIAADSLDFARGFDTTLAIAGIEGTIKRRFGNTIVEGNLLGKTGTLRNVSALSGYAMSLDGEKLVFSFIFNGNYVSRYKDTEEELAHLLTQFFYYNEEY